MGEATPFEVIRSYRDLRVWRLGMLVAGEAYAIAKILPLNERFELAAQIRRAAVSIPSNIAEGHGRKHLGDYVRSLSIANGSLKELETEVLLAAKFKMINRERARRFLETSERLGRMLTVLLQRLRYKLDHQRSNRRPHNPPPTTHHLPIG
jgi:four helix bundle protein